MKDANFDPADRPEIPLVERGYSYKVGTELYLIRHGESMTNTYANLVAYDPNLTALGWAQALRAGAWMAEQAPLDVVIASPLRRAHSTALAIAHAQNLKPVILSGLEEFGQGFGDEIPLHHPTRPWLGRTDWTPTFEQHPGFVAFRDRVHGALAEILERYAGQRIGLISHGGTMGVLHAAMVGAVELSTWTENTGISHFMWPEWQRWLLHYVNRADHLIDLHASDFPRVAEAVQDQGGFWRLPEGVIDSWAALPAHRHLAFLSNRLRRSDRILFIRPPDPVTPLRVSLRARAAVVLDDDLLALEAGELRRALLNANHIRYQYLFNPLPYPDEHFDFVVTPEDCDSVEPEIARVLKESGGRVRWAGETANNQQSTANS